MSKLALYGGTPVRTSRAPLPYTKHTITDDDLRAVNLVLTGDWIAGGGPATTRLENALCRFTGYDHAVVVNSGTAALMLAYKTALEEYEGIYTSPLTFIATVSAALHAGKKVYLGEVDSNYMLDIARLPNDVPVSYAGYPSDKALVSDDAHYLYEGMARFRNVTTSCISLHPAKHVTAGEGGAILTNDGNVAEHCRILRDHGRVGGKAEVAGYNFRLSDINAALAASQLSRAQRNIQRRQEVASAYYDHWHGDERIVLPPTHKYHAWHLFVLRLGDIVPRKWFMDAMRAEGLICQIHYEPIFRLPLFRDDRITRPREHAFTSSWAAGIEHDEIYDQIVSIPLFPSMTGRDIQDVMDGVDKILDYAVENL